MSVSISKLTIISQFKMIHYSATNIPPFFYFTKYKEKILVFVSVCNQVKERFLVRFIGLTLLSAGWMRLKLTYVKKWGGKWKKYGAYSCRFARKPYLCNVFFMVLDLRLTKVGVQRYSFFFAHTSICTKKASPNPFADGEAFF